MKSFIKKDLTERFDFTRAGYRTICICYDKENHKGIWELRKDGSCRGYEVVKGVKQKIQMVVLFMFIHHQSNLESMVSA